MIKSTEFSLCSENKQFLVVLNCSFCGDVIGFTDRRKIFHSRPVSRGGTPRAKKVRLMGS